MGIALAALTLWPAARAGACISERANHNNYLFSVFHRSLMEDRFATEANVFWQKYLHGNRDFFYSKYSRGEVMDEALRRNDTEMVSYLRRLNRFLDHQLQYDAWDYPTKERIAQCHRVMRQLLAEARGYRGKRFRPQYVLMQMRTRFALGQYREAIRYWSQVEKSIPQGVYRDMARNLYAGCLLRTGERGKAVDIYAEQEDFRSLQYCVRDYRNLDGIRKVYADNPNSPTLLYLVQDLVNNTQETMDVLGGPSPYNTVFEADSDRVNWIKMVGARPIYKSEAQRFIDFARSVVADGRSRVPCLWMAAIGCIEHQLGNYAGAKADLARAMAMDGTPRMKDNARALYAANSVWTEPLTADYGRWLTGEMQWLDARSLRDSRDSVMTDDHYRDVKERMVFQGLAPRYRRNGQLPMALALLSMMDNDSPWPDRSYREPDADPLRGELAWNADYSSEYFEALDTLSVEQLQGYADFLRRQPDEVFERYVWQRSYRDANYYDDLLGTRLMAEGRFLEAVPYLRRVSIDFLNRQNIAPYAALRHYEPDRWLVHQPIADSLLYVRHRLTTNRKLEFCHHILGVQDLYQNMRPSEARRQKAYELASLYTQASWAGDCWWLTQYGRSSVQTDARQRRMDFLRQAVTLLEESAASANDDLRQRSLYALAFIPVDRWYRTGWDEAAQEYYDYQNLSPRPRSRQYLALARLADDVRKHPQGVPAYVSRCDVLRRFIRVDEKLRAAGQLPK